MSESQSLTEIVVQAVVREMVPAMERLYTPDAMLSQDEVLVWVGVSERTFRTWRNELGFPAAISGRYSRKAIERWIEKRSKAKPKRRGRA